MDLDISILDYYPLKDKKFIDPMYIPYLKVNIPLDDQGCYIPVSSTADMGNPNYVGPTQFRREWNYDFKRMYPNDPCPAGWSSAGNGICVAIREEGHSSDFYTDKLFGVKYQYFNGYSSGVSENNHNLHNYPGKNVHYEKRYRENIGDNTCDNNKKEYLVEFPNFTAASNNPNTGKYVIYHDNLPNKNQNKYGGLPTRSSYLGI